MKLLAYAMDYWSKGQLKALFLRHEVPLQTPQIKNVVLCFGRRKRILKNLSVSAGLLWSSRGTVGASESVLNYQNCIQRSTCQSAAKTMSTLIFFKNQLLNGW